MLAVVLALLSLLDQLQARDLQAGLEQTPHPSKLLNVKVERTQNHKVIESQSNRITDPWDHRAIAALRLEKSSKMIPPNL